MSERVFDFFPRFTSLVGAASPGLTYVSESFETGEFRKLLIMGLFAQGRNLSADLDCLVETSVEEEVWTQVLGFPLALGSAISNVCMPSLANYVRVRVTVHGADSVATPWIQGVGRTQ